jgi:Tol biopolymer transport system component
MTPTRFGAAVAVLVVLAAISAAAATGTFAGANGRIAFTMRTETGNFDVYTMRPDGTDVLQITADPGTDFNPRWSPDGTKIAFSSNRDGDFDIWTADADGSDLVQVTDSDDVGEFTPSWTSDGLRIVFQRNFPVETAEIWIANADGSGGEQKLADGFVPGTSSRGTKITYTALPDLDLHVLNLEDGTTRTLEGTAFDAEANWSPSGNDLVFSGARTTDAFFDIYVMHANGSEVVQLTDTDSAFQEGSPVWSPDGSLIGFSVCDFTGPVQGDCSIKTMRPDGTNVTPIVIEGALFRVGGRIDWQPLPPS